MHITAVSVFRRLVPCLYRGFSSGNNRCAKHHWMDFLMLFTCMHHHCIIVIGFHHHHIIYKGFQPCSTRHSKSILPKFISVHLIRNGPTAGLMMANKLIILTIGLLCRIFPMVSNMGSWPASPPSTGLCFTQISMFSLGWLAWVFHTGNMTRIWLRRIGTFPFVPHWL